MVFAVAAVTLAVAGDRKLDIVRPISPTDVNRAAIRFLNSISNSPQSALAKAKRSHPLLWSGVALKVNALNSK